MKAFIYGTLKQGQRNNHIMQVIGASKLTDVTTTKAYPLFMLREPFPYLQETQGTGEIIQGELWEVPEEATAALDQFEGAPALYYRGSIEVTDGQETTQANVYFKSRQLNTGQLTQVQLLKRF